MAHIRVLGVDPGRYTVVETQPDSLKSTTPDQATVAVGIGEATDVEFGETGPGLSGRVRLGSNGNGVLDDAEIGLPGIVVNVVDAANNTVATSTTDGEGNWAAPGRSR